MDPACPTLRAIRSRISIVPRRIPPEVQAAGVREPSARVRVGEPQGQGLVASKDLEGGGPTEQARERHPSAVDVKNGCRDKWMKRTHGSIADRRKPAERSAAAVATDPRRSTACRPAHPTAKSRAQPGGVRCRGEGLREVRPGRTASGLGIGMFHTVRRSLEQRRRPRRADRLRHPRNKSKARPWGLPR